MFKDSTVENPELENSAKCVQANNFHDLFAFIRQQYPQLVDVPLHVPLLGDCEKRFLSSCIDTTFVSSVGPAIQAFEQAITGLTNCSHAIATVNGTAALQLALLVAGVKPGSEVITQGLTFIGTVNAIAHCGAGPIFVDVETATLGMSPEALRLWLQSNTQQQDRQCVNRHTGKIVTACVCMHTFGHPARLDELQTVCDEFNVTLIEDAAEAFGSEYRGSPVGARGHCGIFSFNGNKIITTGGGGALVTNDELLATRARHIATTAKLNHPWNSEHDQVGYNFRMPNLNASLGLAQLQHFQQMLESKRQLAQAYRDFFAESSLQWVEEPVECRSNYWLNAVICRDQTQRDELLQAAADNRIQMRPAWQPPPYSKVYGHCQRGALDNTLLLAQRLVNLPSSAKDLVHAQ